MLELFENVEVNVKIPANCQVVIDNWNETKERFKSLVNTIEDWHTIKGSSMNNEIIKWHL
jgi:hypothetical protein